MIGTPLSRLSRPVGRVAGAVVALACGATLMARATPDFSGTWIEATPTLQAAERHLSPTEALHSKGLVTEQHVESARGSVRQQRTSATHVITQTATAITSRRSDGAQFIYRLDGTDSRNAGPAGLVVARAIWEGERLVVSETATAADGTTRRTRRVWSLDQQGQLTIESGDGPARSITIYRKQ